MDDIEIRRFDSGDEAAVRALGTRLTDGFAPWRDPTKVLATIEGWIDSAIAGHAERDHLMLVATDANADVCAFISVEAQDHYIDGRDAYIGELAVDAEYEGRGIARALIAESTEWARAQGCERLTLSTGAANERARAFYERLGFAYEDVSFARELE